MAIKESELHTYIETTESQFIVSCLGVWWALTVSFLGMESFGGASTTSPKPILSSWCKELESVE